MTDTPDPEDAVVLRLSGDEAAVLFELLSRWSSARSLGPPAECFESSAECAVLHSVLGELERQLVEPFEGNYDRIVGEARERLASRWDYPTLGG